MNISDEIQHLHELHQSGALTDAEFAQAKARLLNSDGKETASNFSSENSNPNLSHRINQLRRSKTDQWLGGVCAGLGKFTGLDTWIWRMIFILCVVLYGFGFLIYLLAWIFVPEEE
ncbi:MAG: PspC domain-containing protein [Undibacterium sp.]|nr:PspC domain-containing protein [Undibacterium sp.]